MWPLRSWFKIFYEVFDSVLVLSSSISLNFYMLAMVVSLDLNAFLTIEVLMLCSFFKWFSDTTQKVSLDGISDEVSLFSILIL